MNKKIIILLLIVIHFLVFPAKALNTPIPTPQPTHYEKIVIPIPKEIISSNVNLLLGGLPGYIIYNDLNNNNFPDSDERILQASLKGDLSLTLLSVNAQGDTVLRILSTAPVRGIIFSKIPGSGIVAYSTPMPGTKLLAPPLNGTLLIASTSNRSAKVIISGKIFVVHSNKILKINKPASETIITANTSIVAILYNFENNSAWATELVPSNASYTPTIGFSEAFASNLDSKCKVYAIIVDVKGNYTVYNVESSFIAKVFPNIKGVVYYLVKGCGDTAIAPMYPEEASTWPRPGMLAMSAKGILGGEYILSIPSSRGTAIELADLNGDGKYDVIIKGSSGEPTPIVSGYLKNLIVVSRSEAPLIMEKYGDGIALYSILYPSTSLTPPSGLIDPISGESFTMTLSENDDTIESQIVVIPRTGVGGVSKALASAFTPDLNPIDGSLATLVPTGDTFGSLKGNITIPRGKAEHGFYIAYLLVYQKGIGYATLFRGTPPLQSISIVKPTNTSTLSISSLEEDASPASISSTLISSISAPTLDDLDLSQLAKFLTSAGRPSTHQTYSIKIEKIIINGTSTGSSKPLPINVLTIIIISLVVAIYAIYRQHQ